MGMTPARAGVIRFAGQDVRKLPSFRIAQLGWGWCPRDARSFRPDRGAKSRGGFPAIGSAAAILDARKDPRAVPAAAERGQQYGQHVVRVASSRCWRFGRALMTNPRLLILDEATEGLAPLIRDENLAVPVDAESARPVGSGDRQEYREPHPHRRPHYIIERGRAVWSGTSAQLIAEPDLQHRYLGV